MHGVKNQLVDIQRLTGGEGHYFFGYYDLLAWNRSGTHHLCNRVDFMDRLPGKNDEAELGMVDLKTRSFTVLGKTTAWNFQQGAMLQWNPGAPQDAVVFNIREGSGYRAVIRNAGNGRERYLERAVANIHSTGRYALSINFDRLFDYRPGYGYAGSKDLFMDMEHPEEDGVYLMDMETGKSRLILSLQKIWEMLDQNGSQVGKGKLLVNHITFNTDGSRFVLLARTFRRSDYKNNPRVTAIITANTDGSDPYLLSDRVYASHYYWRDPISLLVHARHEQNEQLYVLTDLINVEDAMKKYF